MVVARDQLPQQAPAGRRLVVPRDGRAVCRRSPLSATAASRASATGSDPSSNDSDIAALIRWPTNQAVLYVSPSAAWSRVAGKPRSASSMSFTASSQSGERDVGVVQHSAGRDAELVGAVAAVVLLPGIQEADPVRRAPWAFDSAGPAKLLEVGERSSLDAVAGDEAVQARVRHPRGASVASQPQASRPRYRPSLI